MVELRTALEVLNSGRKYLKFEQDNGDTRYVRENSDGSSEQINRFAFSGANRGKTKYLAKEGEPVDTEFEQPDGDIYQRIPDGDGNYNYFRNGKEIKGQAYAGASSNIKRYNIRNSDTNVSVSERKGASYKRKDIYSFEKPPIPVCQAPMLVFNSDIEPDLKQHIEDYIASNDNYDKFQAIVTFEVDDRGNKKERSIQTPFQTTDNSGFNLAVALLQQKMRNRVPTWCGNYQEVELSKITLIGRVKV